VLLVYGLTLTPGLSYLSPDGTELATIPYILGLAHSPGYPLFTWLGYAFSHLLPFDDVAYRMNLMSAICGALAVAGMYRILLQFLPGGADDLLRRGAAALSSLLFAFSLTFWSQAVITEVYVPNVFLIVLTVMALLRWERKRRIRDYFLFALVFGLSLGTHISDLGFAPAFIIFTLMVFFESPNPARPEEASGARGKIRLLLFLAGSGLAGFLLGAAQFIWLPLRASSLTDRLMLRHLPDSLNGMYAYTLGAFQNLKFAFSLNALPDRLVIYLDLLIRQFGWFGLGLGILGLFSLLLRRTRYFYLLAGMYLVHIWFFIQYRAFDLEVFFIPAHWIWSIFLAFGLWEVLELLRGLIARGARSFHWSLPRAGSILVGMTAILLPAFSLIPLSGNWRTNDFSRDTAVNDFYANVWSLLPRNAALLTPSGVFGYDAFYWQLIYGTRPDVLLPMMSNPNPGANTIAGRDVYSNTNLLFGNLGPGGLPPSFLSEQRWFVPVLMGEQPEATFLRRESLVLYHLSEKLPDFLVKDPHPQTAIHADFGPAELIGFDLSSVRVESGDRVLVTFYWRLNTLDPLRLESRIGGITLEQHEVGFGLLKRYSEFFPLHPGSVIAEFYWVIIPSDMEPGRLELTLQSIDLRNVRGKKIALGTMEVINEIGTVDRWLTIAHT
jgi:hypothetical protein